LERGVGETFGEFRRVGYARRLRNGRKTRKRRVQTTTSNGCQKDGKGVIK